MFGHVRAESDMTTAKTVGGRRESAPVKCRWQAALTSATAKVGTTMTCDTNFVAHSLQDEIITGRPI